ncbi:hypothetical protein BJV74DRAFT_799381 [Russula compacta]|nr:hypothetical protein BJV74DRAFT_799381 [Russula compacta]
MSSSTPDLVLSDGNVKRFYDHNDLHIYINSPNVTWRNLCACMDTIVALSIGYSGLFQLKQPSSEDSIPLDLQSRPTFGNCKTYDCLGISTPVDTQACEACLARCSSGIPSPVQNKNWASKAPQRCWDMYKQCCITGRGPLLKNDVTKPPDIISCHIFPHAYHNNWVSSRWLTCCTNNGPDNKVSHEYTGYHQICCLNNMILLRSDVHNLFGAYEIGVDIHDDYRVISFSDGHKDLAGCHLKIDLVDTLYCPLPELLTDHLMQGVWQCCVFPGWKHNNQQLLGSLDLVPEAIEGMFDDEP